MTLDEFIERLEVKGAGDGKLPVIREWMNGHEVSRDVVSARLAGVVTPLTYRAALEVFDEEDQPKPPKRGKAKATP